MTSLVFVHGWSVTNTSTYGALPQRLQQQASATGMPISIANIWLSEYVSFNDAVTMGDLVRAFDHALRDLHLTDASFACITHSTGGPLVREWLRAQREFPNTHSTIRLSHLVMLAPANFGSALAQLGKNFLGRANAWFNGVDPGKRILDWLELGSSASLSLNIDHIHGNDPATRNQFLFVLTGDRPDRKLYDHLNSYTGEDGSDGVVRMAAANLNATHAVLTRSATTTRGDTLEPNVTHAPRSAFKLIPGAAHSGDEHGIMAAAQDAVIEATLRCLAIRDSAAYARLCDAFDQENAARDANKVELESVGPFPARVHIHDPRSLLIVRLADDAGEALQNARFLLAAGNPPNPDWMPEGFMLDRQANKLAPNVISFFLNYALLAGDDRVADPRSPRRNLRAAVASHRPYTASIQPIDLDGLVHHALAAMSPADDLLDALRPHQTTVLDVVLPRKVHEGVFRLTQNLAPHDFAPTVPGPVIP
ncbi:MULTISPECIES: phospholipase [Dyella]|uniref:Phospholipase n=2 Tax=Dyella TaxID=231454 RepID=A0A4R0YV81_9GAMM|nr:MULTISPECIES: phospholipase [Dyella]TBR39075.1 phospholipase [Dyella terrae]TCI13335.1 phospholipase [Dyella soli]